MVDRSEPKRLCGSRSMDCFGAKTLAGGTHLQKMKKEKTVWEGGGEKKKGFKLYNRPNSGGKKGEKQPGGIAGDRTNHGGGTTRGSRLESESLGSAGKKGLTPPFEIKNNGKKKRVASSGGDVGRGLLLPAPQGNQNQMVVTVFFRGWGKRER